MTRCWISKSVRTNRRTPTSRAMDRDGDYRLSLDEFRPASKPAGGEESAPDAATSEQADPWASLLGSIDTNGDGAISLDEFKSQSDGSRFQGLDANRDKLLSVAEFTRHMTAPEEIVKAQERFKAKDADADGSLTVEEYTGGDG